MLNRKNITIDDLPGLDKDRANFVVEYCVDLDARRAAIASGFDPDDGYKIRNEEPVSTAIKTILLTRLTPGDITDEWQLQKLEVVLNIALQRGNVSTALACLREIGKHAKVDAYAAEKVSVNSDREIVDRLLRRDRAVNLKKIGLPADPPSQTQIDLSFL